MSGFDNLRLLYLRASDLKVDREYQRGVRRAWARRIAEEFDPQLFGAISVSQRSDGSYWIIDGQHRVEALRLMGPLWFETQVPCVVVEDIGPRREAAIFGGANATRPLQAMDRYRARLAAEQPAARSVATIAAAAGFEIGPAPGRLSCVQALEKVYGAPGGPDVLARTLGVAARAYGTSAPPPAGVVLGIGLVIGRNRDVFRAERLVCLLQKRRGALNGLIGDARTLAGIRKLSLADAVAELIVAEYNKRKTSGRLSVAEVPSR